MKDASGKRIETGYGYTPPYFAPLHRYAICMNSPSWNQFSAAIVKLIAQCGYDGVFVDNSFLGGDECKYCQAGFRKWIGEHYDRSILARACGSEDVGEILPNNKRLSIFVDRWHTAVVRDRLAMLRQAGAEIKPGFQVFPNVGRFQCAIPSGDGCDLFMFESIPPPGCLVDGDLPPSPEALVTVAPGATLKVSTMSYDSIRTDLFLEVKASIQYPQQCPPGVPVEIVVNVIAVGQSKLDDDCIEDVRVCLTRLEDNHKTEIRPGTVPGVGDARTLPGTQRPPVELKGTWIPTRTGSYSMDIIYRCTDWGHLDVANHTPVRERLSLDNVYRSNLAGLSCTYNSRSRMIGLMHKVGEKGWEAVQELALAEGAANGGRYAIQSRGEPQKKYWKFFRQYGNKMAGLEPYAAVSLLYAYWGGNPGNVGHTASQRIADYLSRQHILYRGLVDRDIEATDLIPAKGHTLILVCRDYELKPEQVRTLQRFVADGGQLLLEYAETRINFTPLAVVFGRRMDKVTRWNWDTPPRLATPFCPSDGRLQGVRFTAFIEPSPKARQLVLHALNYNVTAIESNLGIVTPIKNLTVKTNAPPVWRQVIAKAFNPDTENPTVLSCKRTGSTLELRLPTFRIYQMIELQGSP